MSRYLNLGEIKVEDLLLEQCQLGKFTPRKKFHSRYVEELADSIKNEGLWKPIIVRLHPQEKNLYEVIDGEHRIRALQILGRLYVRAEIHSLNDEEADLLALKVNQKHGQRLDPFEQALHIQKLQEKYQWNQEVIGEKLGRSQQWVSQRLKLVKDSSDELIQAFTTRVVNPSVAREIAELQKEDQASVLNKVLNEDLTYRDTEKLVHSIKNQPDNRSLILSSPVNKLTIPPPELEKFEKEHGQSKLKFEELECPQCGLKLIVNWPLNRANWKV